MKCRKREGRFGGEERERERVRKKSKIQRRQINGRGVRQEGEREAERKTERLRGGDSSTCIPNDRIFTSYYARTIYLNGVLAYSKGVPEFDGVVSRPGHNLPVVGRERNAHDVLRVTHKPPGGSSTRDT